MTDQVRRFVNAGMLLGHLEGGVDNAEIANRPGVIRKHCVIRREGLVDLFFPLAVNGSEQFVIGEVKVANLKTPPVKCPGKDVFMRSAVKQTEGVADRDKLARFHNRVIDVLTQNIIKRKQNVNNFVREFDVFLRVGRHVYLVGMI